MRQRNKWMYGPAAVLCLAALTGCGGGGAMKLANELRFSTEDISDVTISYDEESLTFLEGGEDELIVREYMTADQSGYYAKVKRQGGCIKISEGGKPFFGNGFSRYVEVCLPSSYQGSLTVTTTDGDIEFADVSLSLSALRVDSTSGKVKLQDAAAGTIYLSSTSGVLETGNLIADQIRLETTSGNVICERLEGEVSYTSTSGSAEIRSAAGSGTYQANNSGMLEVTYSEVTGDLSLFNKNDEIHLTLPEDLEFEFRAETKNGSVSTNFQKFISVDGRQVSGVVGSQPAVTVTVETKNGKIEVER